MFGLYCIWKFCLIEFFLNEVKVMRMVVRIFEGNFYVWVFIIYFKFLDYFLVQGNFKRYLDYLNQFLFIVVDRWLSKLLLFCYVVRFSFVGEKLIIYVYSQKIVIFFMVLIKLFGLF